MSFLHLKNKIKTEPKYVEPQRTTNFHKDVFDTNPKPEKKIVGNSKNSSLMIGENVIIVGTIKASHEVTIIGTVDGNIDCNSITIEKSGNVKGKITAKTICVRGKAEGEVTVSAVLSIQSEGHVNGKVFYGEIEIDKGGKLSGEVNHRDKDNMQGEFKELKSL